MILRRPMRSRRPPRRKMIQPLRLMNRLPNRPSAPQDEPADPAPPSRTAPHGLTTAAPESATATCCRNSNRRRN